SLGVLLAARVLQGAFGGGLQPMVQAILADSVPLERRGLAFSVYGVTAVCAPALGPTLGGWITDNYSWRWIFWINLPVGLLALVIYEWFRRDPLIDVRLFTNRNFATANLMMFLVGANSFATTVLVPQFLQTLMGYTAQKAGMVLSVGALFLLVEMPIVGRLVTVFQTRYLVAFGWVLLAGTMYLSTQQLDLAELSVSHLAARFAVRPDPLHLHPDHDRRVHRRPRREEQHRGRARQLHAQHR